MSVYLLLPVLAAAAAALLILFTHQVKLVCRRLLVQKCRCRIVRKS